MKYYACRVRPKIIYQQKDISIDIAEDIKSIDYNDELDGQADDITIVLADTERLWQSDWMPIKGDTIQVSLVTQYWCTSDEKEQELYLGIFEIDEITLSSAPNEVSVKAISVPNNTTLRGVYHSRSWEMVALKKVAQDIADGAKMKLYYDANEEIQLGRVEQSEESDLAFLHKLCSDKGLALKVYDESIVIFDMVKQETSNPTFIMARNEYAASLTDEVVGDCIILDEFNSYSFRTSVRDVYKSCKVSYQESKEKTVIEGTFTDEKKETGKTLLVHSQVHNVGEAIELAKKELRKKNEGEVEGFFSLRGNIGLSAGATCIVRGFGHFDGKYIMTKVCHSIGSSYTCTVQVRRCLDGY